MTAVRTFTRAAQPRGQFIPAEHWCACGAPGCFGLGPPIQPQQWFCPDCRPADYYERGGAR